MDQAAQRSEPQGTGRYRLPGHAPRRHRASAPHGAVGHRRGRCRQQGKRPRGGGVNTPQLSGSEGGKMTPPELKAAAWACVVVGAVVDAYLIRVIVIAWRSGVTYGSLVKGPIRRSENP